MLGRAHISLSTSVNATARPRPEHRGNYSRPLPTALGLSRLLAGSASYPVPHEVQRHHHSATRSAARPRAVACWLPCRLACTNTPVEIAAARTTAIRNVTGSGAITVQ
jgi:hypothetical protein